MKLVKNMVNCQQHYRQWEYDNSIEDFKKRQLHDQMKITYCKQFNIPLLILTKDSDKEIKLKNFIKQIYAFEE